MKHLCLKILIIKPFGDFSSNFIVSYFSDSFLNVYKNITVKLFVRNNRTQQYITAR